MTKKPDWQKGLEDRQDLPMIEIHGVNDDRPKPEPTPIAWEDSAGDLPTDELPTLPYGDREE